MTDTEGKKPETTIAENIDSLAGLVKAVKVKHRLSESTVMRVVDLAFALADRDRQNRQYQPQPDDDDGIDIPLPDDIPQIPVAEEGDDEAIAAALPTDEE